ncbi:MAG: hypothetical protein ABIL58_23785 [Pseudomonadota bacterium]
MVTPTVLGTTARQFMPLTLVRRWIGAQAACHKDDGFVVYWHCARKA